MGLTPDQRQAANLKLRLITSQRNVTLALEQLDRALARADRALEEAWQVEQETWQYIKSKEEA